LGSVQDTRQPDGVCNNLTSGQVETPIEDSGMKAEGRTTPSTWAPLRTKVFRWLWLASMVSNVGSWMQGVGAQWFLVHAAHAAILVSLVQTADMLPDVLFGIVGGVLADTLDRRRLLIAVQAGLVVAT
jgi:MFS family permease